MENNSKIPPSLIGLLGKTIPDHYSWAETTSLFLTAGAPDTQPIEGNKTTKTQAWLREINTVSAEPLKVLGAILEDFMSLADWEQRPWDQTADDWQSKLGTAKTKIREALAQNGLALLSGGVITRGGATPTISLDEKVKKQGLASIEIEIQRGLSQVESDPQGAAQFAGNVLEATLKAYLEHKKVTYKEGNTLAELWKLASEKMKLKAGDYDNNDLKKIASGMHSVVDGIAHLRNTKSGAHGKSEAQRANIVIKPRHARLALHSAHTIAAYILELIE